MQQQLSQSIEAATTRIERLRDAMAARLEEMGFGADQATPPPVEALRFEFCPDPASGADSLVGVWRNRQGERVGEVIFHTDGSYYAEWDVVAPHPTRPRWFVEVITAWGRDGEVKADPRLLRAP